MENNKQVTTTNPATLAATQLLVPSNFELAQRMAKALSQSSLIPASFQNNLPNCLIALEMAARMGASPMAVMQNLYVVHGKPAWSSQFVIAAINCTGRFSPLRFQIEGDGDKRQCIAWAVELGTNERLEGPPVSIDMAKKEGWFGKNGSKWQTMPELMLRYRAATFFGRLYAPEILMGMKEESEVIDVDTTVGPVIEKPTFSVQDERRETFAPQEQAGPEIGGGSSGQNSESAISGESHEASNVSAPAASARKLKKKATATKKEEKGPSDESKPTAAPEPTSSSDELTNKIIKRLQVGGFSVDDLMKVALANEWVKPGDTFDTLSQDDLKTFIDEWTTVQAQLEEKTAK